MARVVFAPSSAAIALSRRFLSAFNSATILCVSKRSSYFGRSGALIVADLRGEIKQTKWSPVEEVASNERLRARCNHTNQLSSAFTALVLMGEMPRFAFETILTSEPFRKRSCTNSYLCASEHRTKERDFSRKVSFWMSPRLALNDNLALDWPIAAPT